MESKATTVLKQSIARKIEALENGEIAEFTPEEAEELGAFEEDALSETDAYESRFDEVG